jgi:trans-aconitate methyltransferase
MSAQDPVDLLFGGMAKLGPGDDALTRELLLRLPLRALGTVVDAGCGTGRQTLVLARVLGARIHAVDTHAPFLETLGRRAEAAGLAHLVSTRRMDMRDIPTAFPRIDLLWSEGAAYSIGFGDALALWARAIVPGGFAVVSELAWLQAPEEAPAAARDFFAAAYPAMRTAAANAALAEAAGYAVRETRALPRGAWTEGYYDVLAPRAKALGAYPDPAVRAVAEETLREIEVFARAGKSYGYVFYVLERL